jgi:hypothetical protein
MTARDEEEHPPVPLWRKALIVALIFLLVGPLLFSLLYSGLTGSASGRSISRLLLLYGPLPWALFLVMVIGLLGGYYVWSIRKADEGEDQGGGPASRRRGARERRRFNAGMPSVRRGSGPDESPASTARLK